MKMRLPKPERRRHSPTSPSDRRSGASDTLRRLFIDLRIIFFPLCQAFGHSQRAYHVDIAMPYSLAQLWQMHAADPFFGRSVGGLSQSAVETGAGREEIDDSFVSPSDGEACFHIEERGVRPELIRQIKIFWYVPPAWTGFGGLRIVDQHVDAAAFR